MSINIKFEAVKKKTASFWVSVAACAGLALAYIASTFFAALNADAALFQNAGAIGVACVLVAFAIKSQFDSRRQSWHFIANSMAIGDLMVSLRIGRPLQVNEVTAEQAGNTVQNAFDMLADFHRKGDNWLVVEVCLLVVFTLQWGFGDLLFKSFCEVISC